MPDVVKFKGEIKPCVHCETESPDGQAKGGAVIVKAGSQYQVECLKIGFLGCGSRGSLKRKPEEAVDNWNELWEKVSRKGDK